MPHPLFRVQSFSPFRSPRVDSTRLDSARRGVEPKKVYRKMAARIYVIRGRRLFPSFLHLLYTAAATRRVVQRRGAGTTQLPRKLLHNKTACTFSYSRLCSPHPHFGDATIATDLRPPSLPLSFRPSFASLPLSPNLPLSSHFPLFVLSLGRAGRKSIGTVHLCACRWPDRKKGGETSIPERGEGGW